MKLHFGCGKNKEPNYVGVDMAANASVDVVWDHKTYPLPFPDNSVDHIICANTALVEDLTAFMEELWRISKNKTEIRIISPYYTHIKSISNPFVKRQINEWTFMLYNKQVRDESGYGSVSKCNLVSVSVAYKWSPEWLARSEEVKEFARVHYNNVIEDIMITLCVVKD